ncbi:nucleotidyltransferase domain-containing protein [Virgibacillus ndiopensis]|uniref:nucleotidyltransferase domain-containing protein n=1 Tax=Virgibacillus ndiopensis TaxID=2004408 RepID=UPI000C080F88|nr:nucleotidyltransferase domain-containing protein [Virgibacillus ndiopensis]
MEQTIYKTLKQIEEDYHVKVLYACEAGSRAWGIASEVSDFDIRFIYIHHPTHYLSIDPIGTGKKRDVIELPVNNSLDVSGWDLIKALRLFRKSNPSLLEWIHSSIVYSKPYSTIHKLKKLLPSIFNPKECIFHYLNMAKTNFRKCKRTAEPLESKTVINVIRPILIAKWIKEYDEFPPVEFTTLLDKLISPGKVNESIHILIKKKITTASDNLEVNMDLILAFAAKEMNVLEEYANRIDMKTPNCTKKLDRIFQETLGDVWE